MASRLIWRLVAGLMVLAVSIAAMPVRAQDVVADPTTHDFFSVYVGRSATMTGTITNTTGGTIHISNYEWIYNPLDGFAVTSPISVPYPLPARASVDYQVTFAPPDISFWNALLRFYTDSPITPFVDVEFWGFGDFPPDVPTIAVSPTTLDFGEVLMGTTGNRTVTITNIGGGDLAVNLIVTGSTDLDFTPGAPTSFTLTGGQELGVIFRYSPSDIGDDTASLVIAHNDPSLMGDIVVPMSGAGIRNPGLPIIEISPLAVNFGEVAIGSDSSQTITINNAGGGVLFVNLSTVGSTDFDLAPDAPTSLALSGGASQDVALIYSPSDVGDDGGDLVIVHNDPLILDDVLLPLSGTGFLPVGPNIVVSPLVLDFGSVPVGGDSGRTTTITNTGDGLLEIYLSTAGSTDFDFAPGTPTSFSLPFGVAQAVELHFTPSDVGDEIGDLVIAHNDPDLTEDIPVRLSGTGISAAKCDADADGDIDKVDVIIISLARNTPASGPDDPRDGDENGVINVLDARVCTLMCTLAACVEIN